jgi:hypothetical protein
MIPEQISLHTQIARCQRSEAWNRLWKRLLTPLPVQNTIVSSQQSLEKRAILNTPTVQDSTTQNQTTAKGVSHD